MKRLINKKQSFASIEKIPIKLPVNLTCIDHPHFQKNQTWKYWEPKLFHYRFVITYPKGCCTNVFFKPKEEVSPWQGYYKAYNRKFFLGASAKRFWEITFYLAPRPHLYFCVNDFADNYFHWFTEVLPKMLFVRAKDPFAAFFIPFSLKKYQLESLKICNIDIVCSENRASFFSKITIVGNFAIYPGIYHPELIRLVREQFLKVLQCNKVGIKRERKVYVTRKSAKRRRLKNEEEILPLLKKNGFEILDFDIIHFNDQLNILSETQIFVSMHGAALTNMLFLPKNASVVEILPVSVHNDKCYYTLAGTLDLHYYYMDCLLEGESHITADFIVNKVQFEHLIQEVSRRNPTRS